MKLQSALFLNNWSQNMSKKAELAFFLFGFCIVLAAGLIYISTGENALFQIHDQLDGEVLTYVFASRYFGQDFYPNIMGGISVTALQMPAPGLLLFFLLFQPPQALAISASFEMVIAYSGMWLLLKHLGVRNWIACITCLLFAFLPLRPVYGLCMTGIPLLLWSYLRLYTDPQRWSLFICAAFITVLYGAFSSPVLVGFVVAIIDLVLGCMMVCFRPNRAFGIRVLALCAILIATYVVANLTFVVEMLGASGAIGHKTELQNSAQGMTLDNIIAFLVNEQDHTVSNRLYIGCFSAIAIVCAIVLLILRKYSFKHRHVAAVRIKEAISNCKTQAYIVCAIAVAIVIISLGYVLFHSPVVVDFRNSLSGTLKSFQADRFYWLYPFLWYLLLGVSAEFLMRLLKAVCSKRLIETIFGAVLIVAFLLTSFLTAKLDANTNPLVATVERSMGIEASVSGSVTWKEFFGVDLFEQLKEDIGSSIEPPNKVISLGLYPSIAAYNGLDCIDGYSNNYPLSYKHEFRKIIAGELELSPDIEEYFDKWGNRCYLFSHELMFNYFWTKDLEKELVALHIDASAITALGGKYVISSVKIINPEDTGLTLAWMGSKSAIPYQLFVYRINAV